MTQEQTSRPSSRRTLLRSQLRQAWERTAKENYAKGLIHSERALQVFFCLHLADVFADSGTNRLLMVEQVVKAAGERRYPDLLVCNRDKIIGVVEFKFTPRIHPETNKDLGTLAALAKDDRVEVVRLRYRGPKLPKTSFILAQNSVRCWAGLYAAPRIDLDPEVTAAIGSQFMRLDAVTHADRAPDIHCG